MNSEPVNSRMVCCRGLIIAVCRKKSEVRFSRATVEQLGGRATSHSKASSADHHKTPDSSSHDSQRNKHGATQLSNRKIASPASWLNLKVFSPKALSLKGMSARLTNCANACSKCQYLSPC